MFFNWSISDFLKLTCECRRSEKDGLFTERNEDEEFKLIKIVNTVNFKITLAIENCT